MKLRWRMLLGAVSVPLVLRALDVVLGGNVNTSVAVGATEHFLLLALATAELGALLAVTYERGLRVTTAIVGALTLFLVGLSSPSSFFDSEAMALWTLAIGVALATLEATVRSSDLREFLLTRRGVFSLAGGVVLLGTGVGLDLLARGPSSIGFLPAALTWVVIGPGLVALGTCVAGGFFRHRVVTPLLVLVGWTGWAIVEAWRMSAAGELPTDGWFARSLDSLTPFPDYVTHLPSLLTVVLAVVATELLVREAIVRTVVPTAPTPE
ncbi:hypothetical protein [Halomarina oriensis]|uniref:Uncharacterized protein n=1 Tax=Halomarina oriensis TaxID=671145 RepID=A0A6B0GLM8_9EURY|nr:hypothetical protein [Halomarina oriensis]MWG35560.1 hypothetical protein [Halomarina oriensis]